jgi:mono/diheme cytochrome c family protein
VPPAIANKSLAEKLAKQKPDNPLLMAVHKALQKNDEAKKYGYKLMGLEEPAKKSIIEGAAIFKTLCAACHGPEGQGLPSKIAPPLIGKFKLIEQKEGVIKILLHGLTGPVDGKKYNDVMPPMRANSDEWIASVLNYVRYDLAMKSFPTMSAGYNNWVIIKPEHVKKVRDEYAGRTAPWTWEEIKNNGNKK